MAMSEDALGLLLYKKGREIQRILNHISEAYDERDYWLIRQSDVYGIHLTFLVDSAGRTKFFSSKMKACVYIQDAAISTCQLVHLLASKNVMPEIYRDMVLNAIEEYRILFVKWIRTFDQTLDKKGDWGIRYSVALSDDFDTVETFVDPATVQLLGTEISEGDDGEEGNDDEEEEDDDDFLDRLFGNPDEPGA